MAKASAIVSALIVPRPRRRHAPPSEMRAWILLACGPPADSRRPVRQPSFRLREETLRDVGDVGGLWVGRKCARDDRQGFAVQVRHGEGEGRKAPRGPCCKQTTDEVQQAT